MNEENNKLAVFNNVKGIAGFLLFCSGCMILFNVALSILPGGSVDKEKVAVEVAFMFVELIIFLLFRTLYKQEKEKYNSNNQL